jgi:hypothetical protein
MPELAKLRWRKSRRSIANGECVEVAPNAGGIALRDSKDPGGTVLACSSASWQAFTRATRQGCFDAIRR